MKNTINKWLSDWWVFHHTMKAYWRMLSEQDRPIRDVPTKALELYLEKMNGQVVKNDSQLKFLKVCKFEYEWRDQIN